MTANYGPMDQARRPKVLLVGPALDGGGGETHFRLLARHLFDGTADVAVLKSGGGHSLGPGRICHDLGWLGPKSYPTILKRLRALVGAGDYDAVFGFGLYPNCLCWLTTRRMRQPPALVMTEITRPATADRLFGPLRRMGNRLVRRLTYPAADMCAANSHDGVREIVDHFSVPPEIAVRVPNLVDFSELNEAADQPLPGTIDLPRYPSLCMVTRLDGMKRVDTLLGAVAALPAHYACQIDLVGDGQERGTLRQLAEKLGIAERVHFHGWQTNPFPFLQRATAMVLASEYEGFSNSVLEAMAIGVPVITSHCSTDALQMDKEGMALGFPVGDSDQLKQCIIRLLDDTNSTSAMIAKARQLADGHSLFNALPVYERLICHAITRQGRLLKSKVP